MRVELGVVTPLHITGSEIPPTLWTVTEGFVSILDTERYVQALMSDPQARPDLFLARRTDLPAKIPKPLGQLLLLPRQISDTEDPLAGEVYIPGSAIKGSIVTALLSEVCIKDPRFLKAVLRAAQEVQFKRRRSAEMLFWKAYRKYIPAQKDPLRAISVSDAEVKDGQTVVLQVKRGRIATSAEFIRSGRLVFDLGVKEDLWEYLSGLKGPDTVWGPLGSLNAQKLIDIWTNHARTTLQELSHYVGTPSVDKPVLLGRFGGWFTKTLWKCLKSIVSTDPALSLVLKKLLRRDTIAPKTFWQVDGKLPGVLEVRKP